MSGVVDIGAMTSMEESISASPGYRPYFWLSIPGWHAVGRIMAEQMLTIKLDMFPYGPIYPILRPSSIEGYLAISYIDATRSISHTLVKINYNGTHDLLRGNESRLTIYAQTTDLHRTLETIVFMDEAPAGYAPIFHTPVIVAPLVDSSTIVGTTTAAAVVPVADTTVEVDEDPLYSLCSLPPYSQG